MGDFSSVIPASNIIRGIFNPAIKSQVITAIANKQLSKPYPEAAFRTSDQILQLDTIFA